MRLDTANLLGVAIAAALPFVIFGNALLVLLLPWTADVQYALPGFPDDPLGLKGRDRAEIAETGIRSIWPFGSGPDLLREARLPDGSAAFTEFEIRHMEDVRSLVRVGLALWLAAALTVTASLLGLRRLGRPDAIRAGIGRGAVATLAILGAVGLLMLVAYEAFFDGFHALFFADGTWSFADRYTLRRIYPDAFWVIASAGMVILATVQAAGLIAWSRPFRRLRPQTSQ